VLVDYEMRFKQSVNIKKVHGKPETAYEQNKKHTEWEGLHITIGASANFVPLQH
jgi:hypothetical protein